jgi:hypothetical protein
MRFGIGQLVRIKYFKDLEKEHEIDSEGNITIGSCIFLREMKVYCGEVYKVKQVFGDEYELLLKDNRLCYFHKDMLELPNKVEIDTTSHEIVEDIQEVDKPKRTYTKRKVD